MSARPLVAALLRRELTLSVLLTAAMTIAGAVWLGVTSRAGDAEGALALPRLLRRADLMLLGAAALLSALRMMQLQAADRADGWLEPYVAAGHSAVRYAIALTTVVVTIRYAWFASAAAAFVIATASRELLHALPMLLAGGLLLVCCITAYAAAWGFVIRDAGAGFALAAAACVGPVAIAAALEMRAHTATVPALLQAWILIVTPPLTVPQSARAVLLDSIYLLVALCVVAALARRLAGRRA